MGCINAITLTVELVTSNVTLLGGSDGVDENVLILISFDGSPIPFWLNGTTEIVYSVKGRSSVSSASRFGLVLSVYISPLSFCKSNYLRKQIDSSSCLESKE